MKRILLLSVAAAFVFLTGCARNTTVKITSYTAFDTFTELTVFDASSKVAVEEIFLENYTRLHDIFDAYAPHPGVSGVFALNASEGEWIEIEPELAELLRLWLEWRAISVKVDITRGAAYDMWRVFREGGALPERAALFAAPGGIDCLEIDGTRARLDAGARIDVGALAKGYAAGRLAAALESAGFGKYLISAGGNVVCGARLSRVGLTDPATGGVKSVFRLENICAVTSGDYQRFRELNGVKYHHIIDPATLFPGGEWAQVTVLAKSSAFADFLSTALFLSDRETGARLAEELGFEVIWVTHAGETLTTPGAAKYFE